MKNLMKIALQVSLAVITSGTTVFAFDEVVGCRCVGNQSQVDQLASYTLLQLGMVDGQLGSGGLEGPFDYGSVRVATGGYNFVAGGLIPIDSTTYSTLKGQYQTAKQAFAACEKARAYYAQIGQCGSRNHSK